MLSVHCTAHVSVIALALQGARSRTAVSRAWKRQDSRQAGAADAVIGANRDDRAWISVIILKPETRTVGVGWMSSG